MVGRNIGNFLAFLGLFAVSSRKKWRGSSILHCEDCVPSLAPGLPDNYMEFLTLASILCPGFTAVEKPTLAHKADFKRQV